MSNPINYIELWKLVKNQFALDHNSFHGWSHWKSVEENGLLLLKHTNADINIVKLFAIFHDSKRENDAHDPDHGKRGAEFAQELRGKYFNIGNLKFGKLIYSCTWHNIHMITDDVDIGTCWDADRLDLIRLGNIPQISGLNTVYGKQIAIKKYQSNI